MNKLRLRGLVWRLRRRRTELVRSAPPKSPERRSLNSLTKCCAEERTSPGACGFVRQETPHHAAGRAILAMLPPAPASQSIVPRRGQSLSVSASSRLRVHADPRRARVVTIDLASGDVPEGTRRVTAQMTLGQRQSSEIQGAGTVAFHICVTISTTLPGTATQHTTNVSIVVLKLPIELVFDLGQHLRHAFSGRESRRRRMLARPHCAQIVLIWR